MTSFSSTPQFEFVTFGDIRGQESNETMTPKRLSWLLAAAAVVLSAALLAAWLVPYFRERTAIVELAGSTVVLHVDPFDTRALFLPPRNKTLPANFVFIQQRGPEWLRLGGYWSPFDMVTEIQFTEPDDPPPDLFYRLNDLRSIDRLSLPKGMLGDSELDQLRRRFPHMQVDEFRSVEQIGSDDGTVYVGN